MNCPICGRKVMTQYNIATEVRYVSWHYCYCGTLFHEEGIDKKHFGKLYLRAHKENKELKERYEYVQRVYLPLIEELTYGRKFLEVGFTVPHTIKYLKNRGWITGGIDLVPNDYIQDDFETCDIPETFDYILMGHCLESFYDPIGALKKAYDLLDDQGLLFLSHPNPEMIFEVGLPKFGYWDSNQNYIMISKPKLEDICKRIGFNVIVSTRNISPRFTMYNDTHLLLQKDSQCQSKS